MWTLPNILTVFRLALLPVMVIFLFVAAPWAAWTCLAIYIIGALTDWLDGRIARKHNLISEFGTFLDPISDKIYVVTIMLMLVATDRITGLGVVLVIAILVREFLVSGLREYLGPKGIKVPVTDLAKWKTAVQMAATGILIVAPYIYGGWVIGFLGLAAATALTWITGWGYLKAGLEEMKISG
ncbi:MAG: CDP-diacylglycerol--glycerol-3-phosphate 3-phosphatidyltransferase [Alphaproteobacteria bacterium]|nr:CDP-diacylglycerol--glycerol-3-phosphate 3-phosphatidyltransferase [Alphaproteobacteria bacterium]